MYSYFYYLKVLNWSLYQFHELVIDDVTAAAQVCDPDIFTDIDPENRTNCENCTRNLSEMVGDVSYVFSQCEHMFSDDYCEDLFEEVITEDGVCFTYNSGKVFRDEAPADNSTRVEEWTLEGGYRNTSEQSLGHPRKGTKVNLRATFKVYRDSINRICKESIQGFKVYFHLPNEVPQMAKHFYLVPYQRLVLLKVTPRVLTTAPELRDYSVDKRQCFFSDERYLRFFKYYTQNNCEVECVANLTVKKCGCQRFHMPEIPGVKLCGISDISCYQSIIQENLQQKVKETRVSDCNCLPTCTSISYDTETSQVYISDDAINFRRKDPDYLKKFVIAQFSVGFKNYQFVAMKRTQLYGTTEFLAHCGGLLGLFLGFSIVSIVELIYFCTVRLICNMKALGDQ